MRRQTAKGRHPIIFLITQKQFTAFRLPFVPCSFFFWSSIFVLCLWPAASLAASSLNDYVRRVEEAVRLATELADFEYAREDENEYLLRITELMPATEDVEWSTTDKELTHVDNSWLHQAIKTLEQKDEDKRYDQLLIIKARLQALEQQVKKSVATSAAANDIPHDRLQQILARREYQPEEKQQSAVRSWLNKIRQKINELLSQIFLRGSSGPGPSQGSLQVIRWLIIFALVVSLVWAAVLFLQRMRLRQARLSDPEYDEETREILGERLDADLTADDLMQAAAEMARKGEYRMAIRRVYLALLYELEQRGKLQLHHAKTNRDYLSELKSEQQIYPPVVNLTNRYERVWYGDASTTLEDYSGFIEMYREVAR